MEEEINPRECEEWKDHEFKNSYYGLTCKHCGFLVPDGHGPWIPPDEGELEYYLESIDNDPDENN